jgi:radical SAM protein with 4Fe4S-binding SPASM domain
MTPTYRKAVHLQWHITERCDRRCTHCYQESYQSPELSIEALFGILAQYLALLDVHATQGRSPRGFITVTGGEPFIRPDFFDLLQRFHQEQNRFGFAILTNGSFIDDAVATRLKNLGVAYVQLSCEGDRQENDAIRGAGSFDATERAARTLLSHGIYTALSFTAHRENYRLFPTVAKIGRQWGVDRVWSDRAIPCGAGAGIEPLTGEQTQEYIALIEQERAHPAPGFSRKKATEIAAHRALQFLAAGGQPYHCHAGDDLLTIQPDGTLLPCRRMPIDVGNVTTTPLVELYATSPLLNKLRAKDATVDGCQSCSFYPECKGGLKCLSFALTGDPFTADPGCLLANTTSIHSAEVTIP